MSGSHSRIEMLFSRVKFTEGLIGKTDRDGGFIKFGDFYFI